MTRPDEPVLSAGGMRRKRSGPPLRRVEGVLDPVLTRDERTGPRERRVASYRDLLEQLREDYESGSRDGNLRDLVLSLRRARDGVVVARGRLKARGEK